MLREIRGDFEVDDNKYSIHIKCGLFKTGKIVLLKHSSRLISNEIPIKISTSTLKEIIEYWLIRWNSYLAKQRRKKRSQSRRGNARKGTRGDI